MPRAHQPRTTTPQHRVEAAVEAVLDTEAKGLDGKDCDGRRRSVTGRVDGGSICERSL